MLWPKDEIMKITWNELTVKFDPRDGDLLADWRWLVGNTSYPILISALGDAFLQETDGSIWWLDVGAGKFYKVAQSGNEFKQATAANVNEWFTPQLVGDLLACGVTLGTDECFSFKKPPVLGGEYNPENMEPTNLSVHFSILGQIYRQVRDLPDGTPIGSIKMGKP
jgi:hypothetical protein